MNSRLREGYIIGAVAIIFFATFGAVTYLDSPHGRIGDKIDPEQIDSRIILDMGHITDLTLPDDFIILGAGQTSSLKFEVFNKDPDNDIDTVVITIPGAEITDGSYDWYETSIDHDWTYSIAPEDTITFKAVDDFVGSEVGSSDYYDVAGNVDDALDFVEDISEGLIITLTFDASLETGMKTGSDAINLQVADMQTESPGTSLTSFSPYPYPYIVAEDGDLYRVMILHTATCDMDVIFDGEYLFGSTRGSDFQYSDEGFKYNTDTGKTVIILDHPGDITVKPVVIARETGLTGKFSLDIMDIEIIDITTGSLEITSIVSDYQEDIPSDPDQRVDNDIDDDGILNNLDDDMDGDGIINSEDQFPRIFNRPPIITGKSADASIMEGEAFTLAVEATDPDAETLTYAWEHDQDDSWTASGNSVTISNLSPGLYKFTVTISDELGNIKTEMVNITILENEPPVIESVSADRSEITVGEDVTLTVVASDPEDDVLLYVWTHDQDPSWEMQDTTITVSDLAKGDYSFTVSVSDGKSTKTDSVSVSVKEKEKGSPLLGIILVLGVMFVLVVIVIIIVMLMVKRKEEDVEDEDTIETVPEPEIQQSVPVEETYTPETADVDVYSEIEPPAEGIPYQAELSTQAAPEEIPSIDDDTITEEEWESPEVIKVGDTCPDCGATLDPEDGICPKCNAEFDIALECPNCGVVVSEGLDKCPNCGVGFAT